MCSHLANQTHWRITLETFYEHIWKQPDYNIIQFEIGATNLLLIYCILSHVYVSN